MPRSWLRSPAVWLATGLGVGLAPRAPGTFGTLLAVPLAWGMQVWAWQWQLLLVLALVLPAVWLCQRASRVMGASDPQAIVLDEVLGFLLACIALPAGWIWLVVAFALFRIFDIGKPWPVGMVERRLSGGLGIVADDLVAGGLCWLLIQGAVLGLGRLSGG